MHADKVRGKGLVLITGKKGSGKSHFATRIIKDIIDTNNGKYTVFANITGLKIEGVQESPEDWRDAPNNSIIFYDEAQLLPWADNSSTKISSDERVANMTLIRKQNKHIVLMTQDPTFIHSALRKLVDYHYHLSHPFKDGKPMVFYFHGALTNIDDKGVWKTHAQEKFNYNLDKNISELYQSIDDSAVHDQTYKVPKKIIFLRIFAGLAVLIAIAAMVFALPRLYRMMTGKQIKESAAQLDGSTPQESGVIDTTAGAIETISTPQQMETDLIQQHESEQQQRRLYLYSQNLPPDYEIRRQDPALQIRAVISKGDKCLAYNAYGDTMTLTHEECKSYVGTGRVYKAINISSSSQDYSNPVPSSEVTAKPEVISTGGEEKMAVLHQ